MAQIRRIEHVDIPFAARRVTPNRAALAALYVRQGENLADISLRKGENTARLFDRLGQLYSGYTDTVQQRKAAETAMATRAKERDEDRSEKEKDRQERAAERREAARLTREREEREAARIMVNDMEPGPVSPVIAEVARRFPETAARFSQQRTLPATVTPGAMGVVAPESTGYDVLEPSKDDLERSRARVFRETQAAETAAARKVDDARMDAAQRQTTAYQNRSLAIQQQQANTAAANAQARLGASSDGLTPVYRNALERVIGNLPANRRGPKINHAERLLAEGNEKELKDFIRQTAIDGENVDTKNTILGRQATLASLRDTREVLKELKAAGVETNRFTGGAEDLARWLGTTTDPRLVALSNRLADTLIGYRRAATGAAFGEREGAAYEKMFPNYRSTLPVNEALLDGLERSMRTYDFEYWRHKVGDEGYLQLFGPPPGAEGADGAVNIDGFTVRIKPTGGQ